MANRVEVLFFGDSKSLQKAVRNAERSLGTFEKKTETLEKRVAATGDNLTKKLTVPLAALGLGALRSASNQEQAYGAIESSAGDAADVVKDFGETAADAYGLSREQVSRLGAVTVAQLKSFGFSNRQAAETTVELQQRAADLAATFGGPVEDAVGAISALLRGERDPIERYGVAIKQADVNARLAAEGLDQLEGEERRLAEAQASLTLLMEQTASAAGQFGREAETTAGEAARAAAEAKNLAAQFGEQLLPVASDILGVVGDVAKAFAGLPEGLQSTIVKTALATAAFGPMLAVGGRLVTVYKSVDSTMRTMHAAMTVGNSVFAGASGQASKASISYGAFAGAIGGVTAALGVAVVAWQMYEQRQRDAAARVDELTGSLDENTGALTENTRAVAFKQLQDAGAIDTANRLGISLELVTNAAMGNADAQDLVAGAVDRARDRLEGNREELFEVAGSYSQLDRKLGSFEQSIGRTTDEVDRSQQSFHDQRLAVGGATAEFQVNTSTLEGVTRASQLAADATDELEGAQGDLEEQTTDLQEDVRTLTDAVNDHAAAERAAIDPVFAAIDAQRRLREAHQRLVEVQQDDEASKDDLRAAQDNVAQAALDAEGDIAALGGAIADGTVSVEGMRDRLGDIDGLPRDVVDQIMSEFETLAPRARAEASIIGREASRGVAAGVTATQVEIRDALTVAIGDAVAAAKLAAMIQSPSRLTAEEIGQPLTEGIAEGILEKMDEPASAIQQVMEAAEAQAKDSLNNVISGARATLGIQGAKDRLAEEEAELEELRRPGDDETSAERKERLAKLDEQRRRVQEAQLSLVEAQLRQIEVGEKLATQGRSGGDAFVKAAIRAGLTEREATALRRQLAGEAFLAADRLHSGGLVGPGPDGLAPDLRPDERRKILQVGEEVLTRRDPRHRANLRDSVPGDPRQEIASIGPLDGAAIAAMLREQTTVLRQLLTEQQTAHRDRPAPTAAPQVNISGVIDDSMVDRMRRGAVDAAWAASRTGR